MKKISIEEQMKAAKEEVEKWPQWVQNATEIKCSSPYYNEQADLCSQRTESRDTVTTARIKD
jgi:hypothetical protein